jgi:hypothetical protein
MVENALWTGGVGILNLRVITGCKRKVDLSCGKDIEVM